jgi:hypothetical protein
VEIWDSLNGGTNALVTTVTANSAGAWTAYLSGQAAGSHSYTAKSAGVTSSATAITIDTTAPAAPSTPTLATASNTGLTTDTITSDDTPTLIGTADNNAWVTVLQAGTSVGKVQANGSGAWSFTVPRGLADGTYAFTTRQEDAAGNLSAASSALSVTVDTAVASPQLARFKLEDTFDSNANGWTLGGAVGSAGSNTVNISGGKSNATSAATILSKAVSLTVGATYTLMFDYVRTSQDGSKIRVSNNTSDTGFFTPQTLAASGTYSLTFVAARNGITLAGDTHTFSGTIDNLVLFESGSPTTYSANPQLTGFAEAGATVTLYDNGSAIALGSAVANSAGAWTFSANNLASGSHRITATQTDVAGNVSALSAAYAFSIAPPELLAISEAAQANDADGITKGTAAQYVAAGVTGIGGAGQPTLAMVNSAINTVAVTGALTDSAAEIQAIVDAYTVLLQSADGVANNDSDNPLMSQYAALGLTGVDTVQEVSLLGDVLDTASRNGVNTDANAIDTVAKLQALADAVQNVMDGDASLAELQSLGVPGLSGRSNSDLATVQAALSAANDLTQLNSLAGLLSVVGSVIDIAPPTVLITDNAAGTANGQVIFTYTFSEPVTGFDASKVTVTGGTPGAFTAVSDTEYTLEVTPAANSTSPIALATSTTGVIDSSGNVATAPASYSQAVDTKGPAVSTVTDATEAAVTKDAISFTVTFDEAVVGTVSTSSFTATNGTVSSVTQVGTTNAYTVVVTPTAGVASGAVALSLVGTDLADALGNAVASASLASQDIDTKAPAVSTVTDATEAAVTKDAISFTVTFDEAVVGTVGTSSFTATNGTVTSVTRVGTSNAYTVVVTPTAGVASGTVALSLVGTDLADALGNAVASASLSSLGSQGIDTKAPAVSTVTDATEAAVTKDAISFTVTFDEAVVGTVGTSSFTATNGTVSSVTRVGTTNAYTVVVTPTAGVASGTVALSLVGTDLADALGNAVASASLASQDIDTVAPTVTSVVISATNASGTLLNADDVVTVTATYSEEVSGQPTTAPTLTIGAETGIALTAGTTTGNTRTWTYTIASTAPTDTGSISVVGDLVAGLSDGAGNAATGSTPAATGSFTADTTAPTATVTTATLANTGSATVQSTEAGTAYLVRSDVTVTTVASITGSGDTNFNSVSIATANSNTSLALTGLADGSYKLYTEDAAGNLSAASANTMTILTPTAGAATIDLGSFGKLIKPVQVEGRWYYYWDLSGDGSNLNAGTLNGGVDTVDHNVLDALFTQTRAQLNTNTQGTGTNTTDLIRFTTLEGVKVALPTANGGLTVAIYPPGTSYADAGSTSNGSSSIYDEMLAIWDAYNGTGTESEIAGIPPGWKQNRYWSATDSPGSQHIAVGLTYGNVYAFDDAFSLITVALQVLFPATFTASSYERIRKAFRLTGTDMLSLGDADVDIKNDITWSLFGYDTNADGTADVTFDLSDIAFARVVNDTTLEVELIANITGSGADKLESAANFDSTSAALGNADRLILTQNAAANNSNAANLGVTQGTSQAGLSVIDLGSFGQLTNPVRVEGNWYYYWDGNKDSSANAGDVRTMDYLESTFFGSSTGQVITATNRTFTINGVQVMLPRSGMSALNTTAQSGTSYTDSGPSTNRTTSNTYDDLLAIWDAYNGTSTGTGISGTPGGWASGQYWTATPHSATHTVVNLGSGNTTIYNDTQSYYVALQVLPIVIDLNQDGALNYGNVVMDVNGDGMLDATRWAGAQDGVLVWDKYRDGQVHDHSQYAFAQYDTSAAAQGRTATDLSGLAAAFDTNQDGVFDAQDEQFADFTVWQDANQNGVSDAGEVKSLAELGLASFNLTSDGVARNPVAGVHEAGQTSALTVDGKSVLVADVGFEFSTLPSEVAAAAWQASAAQAWIDQQVMLSGHVVL